MKKASNPLPENVVRPPPPCEPPAVRKAGTKGGQVACAIENVMSSLEVIAYYGADLKNSKEMIKNQIKKLGAISEKLRS